MEQHKESQEHVHQAADGGQGFAASEDAARPVAGAVSTEQERPFAARVYAAYPRMDIYSPAGSAVVFDALGGYDSQVRWALATLRLSAVYEVERTTVHSSSSTVKLRGIHGEWNTVMFARACVALKQAEAA